jgi:DNA-directed RNA polymerase subunit K/omega
MSDSETYSSDESDSDEEVEKKVLPNVRKKIGYDNNNKMDYDDDEEEEEENDDDEYTQTKKDDVSKNMDNSDDDFDEEDDGDYDEDEENEEKTVNKTTKKKENIQTIQPILFSSDDEDEEEDDDEHYLQKFDISVNKNYVNEFHPECVSHNFDEIAKLSNIVRDDNGNIIDPFHKTIPFLTKYERARVLGQRAKQIETGSKPLVKVPDNIIDGYLIAEMELEQKKIPFIIRRPLPNGASEYWRLTDLQVIAF